MIQNKRRYSTQQKFNIVKEGLLTGTSIAEVCRRHGISNVIYYEWQRRFFEGAFEGLKPRDNRSKAKLNGKLEKLETESLRLKGVIAEITAENLDLKKTLGE